MSPTCSSKFFVGRKARSAAARTTNAPPVWKLPGSSAVETPVEPEHYAMQSGGANREPGDPSPGELRQESQAPCYVPLALMLRRGHAVLVGMCGLLAAGVIGCGGGERQDANEDDASYEVTVVDAKFPTTQRLAEESNLSITVRNDAEETIPNVAVTLKGIERAVDNPNLQDPNRPVFVIDGNVAQIGGYQDVKLAAPQGGQTALVDTWTLGKLEPGAKKTFRWRLTAVKPGPFEVSYAVAAGLGGKAKAVGPGDAQPQGSFKGTITAKAPVSRIAADGRTVVTEQP
jgi:hypothetical protein